jgi:hypothetical protein
LPNKTLVFLLISLNPNAACLCQPCSPPSFVCYTAICYSQKHILLPSALFLFFNELSSSLFPYFFSSAHRLPYFFKPLVFLLISSNPNAAHLCQPCSPSSFVFYTTICYSQKHILSSSSLFLFFNESSSSLFSYFSSSTYRLHYFFKPLVSSLFLQTLTQHVFVNPAHPLLLFFTWPSVTRKSTSCRLPPYFLISLRQHIIFLISSNL